MIFPGGRVSNRCRAVSACRATRPGCADRVCADPATSSTFLVYAEETLNSGGVSAQKFDASGNRLWTQTGVSLSGVTTDDHLHTAGVVADGLLTAFWVESPGFNQDAIVGARTAANGAVVGSVFDVSSSPAQKYRVQASLAAGGDAVVVWQDNTSSDDVQIQNVNPNGTLGLPLSIDTAVISIGSGGTANFALNAGAGAASSFYLMLGSVSGTSPGLAVDGFNLPLNVDAYLIYSLLNSTGPLYVNFLSVLSPEGFGSAAFVLPTGASPSLAGTTFHHAFATLGLAGQVTFTSNAEAFELVP